MTSCCAYHCTSHSKKKIEGITFHRFPKDPIQLEMWIDVLERPKEWRPNKNHRLCSLHFEESMFFLHPTKQKVELLEDAVPTIFPVFQPDKRVTQNFIVQNGHLVRVSPKPKTEDNCFCGPDGSVVKTWLDVQPPPPPQRTKKRPQKVTKPVPDGASSIKESGNQLMECSPEALGILRTLGIPLPTIEPSSSFEPTVMGSTKPALGILHTLGIALPSEDAVETNGQASVNQSPGAAAQMSEPGTSSIVTDTPVLDNQEPEIQSGDEPAERKSNAVLIDAQSSEWVPVRNLDSDTEKLISKSIVTWTSEPLPIIDAVPIKTPGQAKANCRFLRKPVNLTVKRKSNTLSPRKASAMRVFIKDPVRCASTNTIGTIQGVMGSPYLGAKSPLRRQVKRPRVMDTLGVTEGSTNMEVNDCQIWVERNPERRPHATQMSETGSIDGLVSVQTPEDICISPDILSIAASHIEESGSSMESSSTKTEGRVLVNQNQGKRSMATQILVPSFKTVPTKTPGQCNPVSRPGIYKTLGFTGFKGTSRVARSPLRRATTPPRDTEGATGRVMKVATVCPHCQKVCRVCLKVKQPPQALDKKQHIKLRKTALDAQKKLGQRFQKKKAELNKKMRTLQQAVRRLKAKNARLQEALQARDAEEGLVLVGAVNGVLNEEDT